MIEIKTWEGEIFQYEPGSTYKVKQDKFSPGDYYCCFYDNRMEYLRFENSTQCGIYYTNYERTESNHPYKKYWNDLTPFDKSEYEALKGKILTGK